MSRSLPVFIGWDSREAESYDVAAFSLRRHASIDLEILPLKLNDLRASGAYWRPDDPLSSTEFTFSRFLVPFLTGYEGTAVFCDSDFLWTGDIAGMLASLQSGKSVHCVKHDYQPTESIKKDGVVQFPYPRKNWSSLMVFDCSSIACRKLSPIMVNRQTGAYLHRMKWVSDSEIGGISEGWNWLEGWSRKPDIGVPKAIHFTRGGPWLDQWRGVDYAELWLRERADMERQKAA